MSTRNVIKFAVLLIIVAFGEAAAAVAWLSSKGML